VLEPAWRQFFGFTSPAPDRHDFKSSRFACMLCVFCKSKVNAYFIFQADSTDKSDNLFTERYMVLTLSAYELQQLRGFLNGGNLELTQLDSIWSNMLIQAEHPKVTKWYHLSYWMPDITFSREASFL